MNLESEIHAINGKLNAMVQDISLIKQRNEFDAKEKEELTNVVKSLEISINRLNLTIGKKDGVKEGQSTVIAWVSSVIGVIGMVWLVWITNSVVSDNSDIAMIKDKIANDKKDSK